MWIQDQGLFPNSSLYLKSHGFQLHLSKLTSTSLLTEANSCIMSQQRHTSKTFSFEGHGKSQRKLNPSSNNFRKVFLKKTHLLLAMNYLREILLIFFSFNFFFSTLRVFNSAPCLFDRPCEYCLSSLKCGRRALAALLHPQKLVTAQTEMYC